MIYDSSKSYVVKNITTLLLLVLLCMMIHLPFVTSQLSPWYNFYRQNEDKMMIHNGILPTLSCPYGHYRNFDMGIMLDGCIKCPKGYYGNTTNLQSSNCTAPCPKGTYLDKEGGVSLDDCIPCPAGTFGEEEGLISSMCSGRCNDLNIPLSGKQFYSSEKGLSSRERTLFLYCGYGYDYILSFVMYSSNIFLCTQ